MMYGFVFMIDLLTIYPFDISRIYVHPPIVIMNEILMHLRALKKVNKDVSLHDPIGQDKEGNEISLIDILKAENENIIEYIQLNMEIEKMQDYFSVLDNREKEVIIYRYGLNNYKEMTQREIAKRLNISRSYVSRIEKRALMKVFREYYRRERGGP